MAKKASKKWYESATLWTNLAAGAGAYAAYTNGELDKNTMMTALIMAALNGILRAKTDTALSK